MRTPLFLLLCACALVSGCVSIVNSKKATETSPGVRYYLPQVFLKVTPGIDGSVKVEPEYLPDPRHEYVIDTTSFLGNYTIDITRSEKGFLEGVTFNSDSTAIAKQLLTSEANVRAAEIDAKAAKANTEATDVKAAADKQTAAVAAADKTQKDAEVAAQVADAKLNLLLSMEGQAGAPTTLRDQILAARLAAAEAAVRRDAARAAYSTLAANTAAANAPGGSSTLKARDPTFLKVVMSKSSVSLAPQFGGELRETWKIPAPATETPQLQLYPAKQVVRPAKGSMALTARVQSTVPLVGASVTWPGPGTPLASLLGDRTTLLLEFPKGTPAGDYDFDVKVQTGTPANPVPNTLSLTVRVEK
jgi:hypothetical protein